MHPDQGKRRVNVTDINFVQEQFFLHIYYCVFVILYLFNGLLLTMNASSWKKAADIVAKVTPAILQVPVTATVESQSLQSLPLSTLLVDDSRPPWVTYEPQQPIATSTPRATSTESPEISTEAYRQVLPGMSPQLYPTLVTDSLLDIHVSDNQDTLQMQLTLEVDKYLKEVAERHEIDVNYFDS